MAHFERPEGAVEDCCDLKVGDTVWHVYGCWPPFIRGPLTIVAEAVPFRTRDDFSEIHESQGDLLVFEVADQSDGFRDSHYANDGNLVPGYSHNDNYWFRTEGEARAALEFLRGKHIEDPYYIELADDMLHDDWDYDPIDYDEVA